jgi:glycosyltransferase involved in cell wall biosynthesis
MGGENGKRARPVVLHVTECFEGGVGRAMQNIAATATFADHHLLAAGADMNSADAVRNFSSVEALPKGIVKQARVVHRALRRTTADAVHAHSSWAGVYTRTVGTRAALIYQPHGYAFEMSGRVRSAVFYCAEKLLALRSQTIVVLSKREEFLARKLNVRRPTHHLTNLPTVPVAVGDRSKAVLTGTAPLPVVMIGRIGVQKAPAFFLEVVEHLRNRGVLSAPVWVGDGDPLLRKQLEDQNVRVTGWLQSEGIVAELDSAALYMHTAAYEGFPLSVLDAAARGVPVIARRIPAFDGTDVHQASDALGMARDIELSISDLAFRERLVENNRLLLADMSMIHFIEQAESLYKALRAGDARQ